MEEVIYLGTQWGTFKDERNISRRFCSAFFVEEFPDVDNPDYNTTGYRGQKHKLLRPDLVKNIRPFDVVRVFYNAKGTVTLVDKVKDKTVFSMIDELAALVEEVPAPAV